MKFLRGDSRPESEPASPPPSKTIVPRRSVGQVDRPGRKIRRQIWRVLRIVLPMRAGYGKPLGARGGGGGFVRTRSSSSGILTYRVVCVRRTLREFSSGLLAWAAVRVVVSTCAPGCAGGVDREGEGGRDNRCGLGSLRYRLAVENWLRLLVSTPICSDLLLGRKAKRLTSANNLASNSVFNQAILRVLLLRCSCRESERG